MRIFPFVAALKRGFVNLILRHAALGHVSGRSNARAAGRAGVTGRFLTYQNRP